MDKSNIIDTNINSYLCVVCGWADGEILEEGAYCPCCGIEWGYLDVALNNVIKERKRWIESGYKWSIPKLKPEDWDLLIQLEKIPLEYRN